jgi:hypothetical protein
MLSLLWVPGAPSLAYGVPSRPVQLREQLADSAAPPASFRALASL